MKTRQECLNILGVNSESTNEEIKKAYRDLAKKYHPDLNKEDKDTEKKFKEINESYESLTNNKFQENNQGFNQGFKQWSFNMGSMFNQKRQQINLDIKVQIEIPLKTAIKGDSLKIKFLRQERCSTCDGDGTLNKKDTIKCSICNGTGKVLSRTIFSSSFIGICGNCDGTGKIYKDKCVKCGGEGTVNKEREININIPKGTKGGQIIRCKNEGNQGKDKRNGDLLCFMVFSNKDFFKSLQNQQDVYIKMPIPLHIALLGGEIEIPTLHGNKKIKISPKTKYGSRISIPNVGLPKNTNQEQFGFQILEVEIEMPEEINESLKEEIGKTIIDKKSYPQYLKTLVS